MASQYGLAQLTQPATEPVTVAEVRSWLRLNPVDLTDPGDGQQDADIAGMIVAARIHAENYTGRCFVTTQWLVTYDSFYEADRVYQQLPAGVIWGNAWRTFLERGLSVGPNAYGIIRLPKPPVQSVDSVQYIDTSGVLQTVPVSTYMSDLTKEPAWLLPAFGKVWPVPRNQPGAVRVAFTAGYGVGKLVPETVKMAMKLYVSLNYEAREPTDVGIRRVHDLLTLEADYGEYR